MKDQQKHLSGATQQKLPETSRNFHRFPFVMQRLILVENNFSDAFFQEIKHKPRSENFCAISFMLFHSVSGIRSIFYAFFSPIHSREKGKSDFANALQAGKFIELCRATVFHKILFNFSVLFALFEQFKLFLLVDNIEEHFDNPDVLVESPLFYIHLHSTALTVIFFSKNNNKI